jgi:hypothetical protein
MKNIILLITIVQFSLAYAAKEEKLLLSNLKYKTFFGQCPANLAGKLTLTLMKEFEKSSSLKSVKSLIIKDKLDEKYFLSEYRISFDPLEKVLKFEYECPKALMRVQIYKENGDEFYTAILTEHGKLVDPAYEMLLKAEKKLQGKLPNLALPVASLDNKSHLKIAELFLAVGTEINQKISEVIVNDNGDLTIILSFDGKPTTAFLGKDYWSEKVGKLTKVIDYMKEKKSTPAIINLTNAKKIVVKFSDKL